MTIHIENLTAEQVQLLDQMWACVTITDYEEWYSTLSPTQQIMANMLKQLLLIESVEQMLGAESAKYADTRDYLKKFML